MSRRGKNGDSFTVGFPTDVPAWLTPYPVRSGGERDERRGTYRP
jgi:hypothetical protein